jgi:hypothetical protein
LSAIILPIAVNRFLISAISFSMVIVVP